MAQFIAFNKKDGFFYNNLWLEQEKLVIKMPMANRSCENKISFDQVKIEEFSLVECMYILNHD